MFLEPIKPSKRANRICDECGSTIDLENPIWVPQDRIKEHHPCNNCGLIDYKPKKNSKVRIASHNQVKNWWGNLHYKEEE